MPPVSDPMSRVRDRNSSFKKASKTILPFLFRIRNRIMKIHFIIVTACLRIVN